MGVFIINNKIMATGKTVFITYQFEGAPANASNVYGISGSTHCTYIQKLETDIIAGKSINTFFLNEEELFFLADSTSSNGTGFTATRLNILAQVVDGISDSGLTITPDAGGWFKVDVTNQISGQTIGDSITKSNLLNTNFIVNFTDLTSPNEYSLDYLSYPSSVSSEDEMGYGEEAFFFGTIRTDIRATVYTTDISIQLPLNEFNSTTNPTWDGMGSVAISEVGIYDDNNNLVAIGKLNNPIKKDPTIARTIAFQLDF